MACARLTHLYDQQTLFTSKNRRFELLFLALMASWRFKQRPWDQVPTHRAIVNSSSTIIQITSVRQISPAALCM